MDNLIVEVEAFRHGESFYRQGKKVDFFDAKDLTLNGAKTIVVNAKKVAKNYEPGTKVDIFISPYARTKQTARLIAQVLAKRNVKSEIVILDELEESRNFIWPIFEALINGGDVFFGNKKFYIDKNFSNTRNLSYPDFYTEDCISLIDYNTLLSWPTKFVSIIKKIEKYSATNRRMMNFLDRMRYCYTSFKPQKVIIVTHDTLLINLVKQASKGEKKTLNPGQHISLDIYFNKITAFLNDYQN